MKSSIINRESTEIQVSCARGIPSCVNIQFDLPFRAKSSIEYDDDVNLNNTKSTNISLIAQDGVTKTD